MWEEIQDMPGEVFDIEQARAEMRQEKLAREEEGRFLDLCFDLFLEGLVDEDQIEAEAHRIMDEENK